MSAMRKMMLVTRMRMFLKVSHLRIVCALKHKSKIEVFNPAKTQQTTACSDLPYCLNSAVGLVEQKTNLKKAGEAILSEQK